MEVVAARKLIVFDNNRKCSYRTLRPIGTWGVGSRSFVYEAVVVGPPPREGRPYNDDELEHVTLKVVYKRDKVNFESAQVDIRRLHSILEMEHYEILPNIIRYQSIFSDNIHMGILLPRQVHSLRSLMSTRPGLNEGMPQELIAEALRQVMACLRLIHKCLDYHRQISAGSIFYSPQLRQFQLAFAISVYDCYQPGDENVPRCPINTLLDWAKAPEEDQTWLWPSSQFKFPTPLGSRAGSDIWMVGVTALELAYGKIEVADRNQLLSIAAYICKKRKLPNTWQELRAKAESAAGGASSSAAAGGASSSAAAGGASSSSAAASSSASDYPMTKPNSKINSIKKHVAEFFSDNKRFSKSFARFVARCLNDDLTRRYPAEELLKSMVS